MPQSVQSCVNDICDCAETVVTLATGFVQVPGMDEGRAIIACPEGSSGQAVVSCVIGSAAEEGVRGTAKRWGGRRGGGVLITLNGNGRGEGLYPDRVYDREIIIVK